MPSPFSASCDSWIFANGNPNEKKNLLKSASVWSHPRLRILNEAQRVSVKIYLHKCCGFFESTGKISWSPSEGFARSCFRKKLIWKVFTKNSPKRNYYWNPFFSYLTTCNFTKKEPHHSYFLMTFEKIFQNTVLCQSTGKATEGTEVFVLMCFRKKLIWGIP